MKKRLSYGLFFCALILVIYFIIDYVGYCNKLPENIHLNVNSRQTVELEWPLSGEIISNNVQAQNIDRSYVLNVKYMGVFPVKDIEIRVMNDRQLIPCGFPVGIYLDMKGLLVVDTTSFVNEDGIEVEPCKNLLRKGDYILKIDNKEIVSKEFFTNVLASCKDYVVLNISREGECFDVKVPVVKNSAHKNHLGIWIKDDSQGIGTLTYIDASNNFGALGHAMNDSDTGTLIAINSGHIYNARVMSITKGQKGKPGEYIGSIDYNVQNNIGIVNNNTPYGIYGVVTDSYLTGISGDPNCEPCDIAYKEDVTTGNAQIQAYINGSLQRFDIEIEKLDYAAKDKKGITFHVVDEELLSLTNGIVQGMSGSPIIQNGKIIGAVTHVLVNDPTRGYGIFIENMLEH